MCYDNDLYDYDDDIGFRKITRLHQLRHACNVFGHHCVAHEIEVDIKKINSLYYSKISGATEIASLLKMSDDKFKKEIETIKKIYKKQQDDRKKAQAKNEQLVRDLKLKRKQFAGIGTNKAKRRLNKLAKENVIAQAVRLALEIEDKSITAKNSYGKYQNKIYNQKTELIMNLCDLFQEQKWVFGVHKSNLPPTSHVVFFEIPECEQISWHFTPPPKKELPVYNKEWDKQENSTLEKLEKMTVKLLHSFDANF